MKRTLFRLAVTLLFLLVPVLGTWTFVIADDHGWWFPENVSTYGPSIDRLFYQILVMVTITFLLTEGILVWCIFWYGRENKAKAWFTHGIHKLELFWTAIPAVLLLVITFAQMGTWAEIKFTNRMPGEAEGPYSIEHPLMEVYASQFDWRVRYPDPDGSFDGPDVIESAYDIYVPVDVPVFFDLKSRDVLHSFFVPQFRLKQDAVPGTTIPVWFEATKTGDYDLICAELCGWGHYKMAGRIHVMEQDAFEGWLADQREALWSNGTDELEEDE